MDLNISFDGDFNEQDMAALKKFLEQEGSAEMKKVEYETSALRPGDQGSGEIIGLIVTLASGGVLTAAIGLLSQFCQQFDRRLKGPNGIVIDGRDMTPEQRTQIAIAWAPK